MKITINPHKSSYKKVNKQGYPKGYMMTTVTESSGDGSYSSSILQDLKAMDLINQLEIADGLRQLLLNKDFTLKSLLNASASDLAKILGIDEYIAKIVHSAIRNTAKEM